MGLAFSPRESPRPFSLQWEVRDLQASLPSAMLATWAWTSSLQNCEKYISVLYKLPRLWNFVTAWIETLCISWVPLGLCVATGIHFDLPAPSCCFIVWISALPRVPQYLWLLAFLKLLSQFCELPYFCQIWFLFLLTEELQVHLHFTKTEAAIKDMREFVKLTWGINGKVNTRIQMF